MKKILLVGKLNEYSQNLYAFLSGEYKVQFSTESIESVKGMASMEKYDMIMLSIVELDERYIPLFNEIQRMATDIPIFIVGTQEEYKTVRNYFFSKKVMFVDRHMNDRVLRQCQIQFGETVKSDGSGDMDLEPAIEDKKLPTILVVDDSALSLRNMKRILEPTYKTILVSNGSQAVTQINKRKPDLIILDYEMPVFNGEKIFKLLQTSSATKDIPVIFLTGISDKANTVALLKLNPAGYFLKPPDTHKLLETIDDILRKQGKL